MGDIVSLTTQFVSLTTQFVSGGFVGISTVLAGMSGGTAPVGLSGETVAVGTSAGIAAAGDFGETMPVGSLTESVSIFISDGTVPAGIRGETASVEGGPVGMPGETGVGISGRAVLGGVAGETMPVVGISGAADPADVPDGTCSKHSRCAARAFLKQSTR